MPSHKNFVAATRENSIKDYFCQKLSSSELVLATGSDNAIAHSGREQAATDSKRKCRCGQSQSPTVSLQREISLQVAQGSAVQWSSPVSAILGDGWPASYSGKLGRCCRAPTLRCSDNEQRRVPHRQASEPYGATAHLLSRQREFLWTISRLGSSI